MADTKITGLTALTGANSAPDDLMTLVDVSDTTMDAAGTNKSITRQELQTYNAGTLTTDVKVLDLSATWNDAGVTFTGLKFNVTDTASNAASLLLDLQIGGNSLFQVGKNTIDKRNSTNAQLFYLYNSYTDASNYERGYMQWVGNEFQVGAVSAGTGTARNFVMKANEVKLWSTSANGISFLDTGGAGKAVIYPSNTNFGLFLNGLPILMVEQTAPSAPSSNRVAIYAQDNGSGKTQLMALFASGAAQQIAIEP